MYRSVICASFLALLLNACSSGPYGGEVVEQAKPGGKIAFDLVQIDDGVVKTLEAQHPPPFATRFKEYIPAPDLKIATGDIVGITVWESADNGLFGNSLTELSFPAGSAARALTGGSAASALAGVPSSPGGLTVSPNLMALLFGATGAAGGLSSSQTSGLDALSTSGGGSALGGGSQTGNNNSSPTNRPSLGMTGLSSSDSASTSSLGGFNSNSGSASGQRGQDLGKLLDVASQSGRPGTRIPDQQVGTDGAISIPFIGRVNVAGRTPTEVEKSIEAGLRAKALDPQVLVVDKKSVANTVSVAGEVVGGARIPLSPGGDRLLQVIAEAGGAKAPPHETFVRLSRGDVTATVSLATLVSDPSQDIYAEPGDVLTLVRRPQIFSVFGATGKNTVVTFNSDKLPLSDALAKAGGLNDDKADPRAVFLFRYEPESVVRALGQPMATDAPAGISPVAYRLDLMDAKSYLLAKRFAVHDQDVIYVANARAQAVYQAFTALSQVVGPVETGFLTCYYAANC